VWEKYLSLPLLSANRSMICQLLALGPIPHEAIRTCISASSMGTFSLIMAAIGVAEAIETKRRVEDSSLEKFWGKGIISELICL
jgi:hypothetical protein